MLDEITRLKHQVHQLQLERDILTKTNELIKKTWASASWTLKSRQKTQFIDVLKEISCVADLLCVLRLARSCYFYHKASPRLKISLQEIFDPAD